MTILKDRINQLGNYFDYKISMAPIPFFKLCTLNINNGILIGREGQPYHHESINYTTLLLCLMTSS